MTALRSPLTIRKRRTLPLPLPVQAPWWTMRTIPTARSFFTITTADGNVFYLVIDRQRGTENVYFLNTVTESDLMALAEIPESTVTQQAPTVQPEPVSTTEPEAEPEPEPEAPARKGMGALPVILAVALIGGGAGWYFKVYRPKQAQVAAADDYDASEYAEYMDETIPRRGTTRMRRLTANDVYKRPL